MSARTRQPHLVWWERQSLEKAIAEAERTFPQETGGVLLGWRANSREVVVVEVVGPGPNADHRARSFRPDAAWQQEQINDTYASSGRRITYLGDWHTHPAGSPSLSPRDIRTLRRIARHNDARAPQPVMAVLGGGDPEWHMHVSQINSGWALRTRPLQVCLYNADSLS
jgi:integrative and conjugative element protein (TIGR02256 family)